MNLITSKENKYNRFCRLIIKINTLNDKLDQYSIDYYNGGYSFEEIYKTEIDLLSELHFELKEILDLIQHD
jgi:hypothetical protein